MGSFLIIPRTGERYVATVAARTGDTLRIELPEVDDDGYALAAVQTPDEVRYRVNRDPDKEFEPMTVVAHVRGKCIGIQNLNPMNPTGRWKTDSIPEGNTPPRADRQLAQDAQRANPVRGPSARPGKVGGGLRQTALRAQAEGRYPDQADCG